MCNAYDRPLLSMRFSTGYPDYPWTIHELSVTYRWQRRQSSMVCFEGSRFGHEVQIIQVQGYLFWGIVDKLTDVLTQALGERGVKVVLIDLTHVH